MSVIVGNERYKELIRAEVTLAALESGGVDNWSYYGDSISNFKEQFIEENKEVFKDRFENIDYIYMEDIIDYLVEGVTKDGED